MQVTIELGSLPDDGYNLTGAAYLRTVAGEMDVLTPPGGGSPRYGAADVLRLVADAVEAQEPIKPGVYYAKPKGWFNGLFAEFDGEDWTAPDAGVVLQPGLTSRSGFEVLEFIGTREGRDD